MNVWHALQFLIGMGRANLIRTNEFPYHVWARVNNKERWPASMDLVWDLFRQNHNEIIDRYSFETYAFVLMNNHYHWLVATPESNLDDGMRYFQTMTSRRISELAGRLNRLYGSRYGWSVIRTDQNLLRIYRYILMNPVRAGVCARPDQYHFSTLTAQGWKFKSIHNVSDQVPDSAIEKAKWMLRLREADDENRIRIGLRRKVFALPRNRSSYLEL